MNDLMKLKVGKDFFQMVKERHYETMRKQREIFEQDYGQYQQQVTQLEKKKLLLDSLAAPAAPAQAPAPIQVQTSKKTKNVPEAREKMIARAQEAEDNEYIRFSLGKKSYILNPRTTRVYDREDDGTQGEFVGYLHLDTMTIEEIADPGSIIPYEPKEKPKSFPMAKEPKKSKPVFIRGRVVGRSS